MAHTTRGVKPVRPMTLISWRSVRRVGVWLIGVSMVIAPAAGCRSPSGSAPFDAARPLELERGSYLASQRDHYNRIYAARASESSAPNTFLVECLDRIDAIQRLESADATSRDAMDIAMGDGRNTIAMAQRGYRVVGMDISDVGVNTARRRAAELGLAIDARVDLFSDAYLQEDRWDLVALMHFGVDANVLERVRRSVRPGGWLIMERSGGDAENGLLRRVLDWDVVVYESAIGERDWSAKRPRPDDGWRTRLLVRRPIRRGVE